MNINEWYDPEEIIKCEIETTSFLSENINIQEHFNELSTEGYIRYHKYKNKKDNMFCYESLLDIEIENLIEKAYVGAFLDFTLNPALISYYFLVINGNKIMRKFHFDYTLPKTMREKPHPIFHIHYAGRLTKFIEDHGFASDHLDEDYDEPRLFYTPMSLALMINLVFMEYSKPDKIKKILINPEWKNLVRKNEVKILKPYYEICNNFFSNNKDKHLFINDFYYDHPKAIKQYTKTDK